MEQTYSKEIDEIVSELEAAVAKHPQFTNTSQGAEFQAISILTEEVGELAQAVNDGSITEARREAAQVGAVVIRLLNLLNNM